MRRELDAGRCGNCGRPLRHVDLPCPDCWPEGEDLNSPAETAKSVSRSERNLQPTDDTEGEEEGEE
jgi:predicted amidophosphoribosyltransferase